MIQRRMKRKQGCLEKVIKDIATKEVGWAYSDRAEGEGEGKRGYAMETVPT